MQYSYRPFRRCPLAAVAFTLSKSGLTSPRDFPRSKRRARPVPRQGGKSPVCASGAHGRSLGSCPQRRRPKGAGWVSNPPRRPGHPPGRRSVRATALRGDPGPEDSHSRAEVLQAPSAQFLGRARIVDVGGDDERALACCPTAITCDLQGGVSNPANDPHGEGRPLIVCSSRTLAFGSHSAAWPVS